MREYAGRDCDFRVTVGESGSSDGSLGMLENLERRGWIELQHARRSHAEWLDHWLATCSEDLAVFVDSDVEVLRAGWLDDLVRTAREHSAVLVCGEMLPEQLNFIEPVSHRAVRLAARPAPWLLLVNVARVRPTGCSFAFSSSVSDAVDEGLIAYDVGATLFRELSARNEIITIMPSSFRRKYFHYAGMSWRPDDVAGRGLRFRWRARKGALHLSRLRQRQDG
jgi:hypothetical protein